MRQGVVVQIDKERNTKPRKSSLVNRWRKSGLLLLELVVTLAFGSLGSGNSSIGPISRRMYERRGF